HRGTAYTYVPESTREHERRAKHIPSINDQRTGNKLPQPFPIDLAKLLPFGCDHDHIGPLRRLIWIRAIANFWQNCLRPFSGLRIVSANLRPFADKAPGEFDSGRITDIVSIGFECKSPHRDFLSTNRIELLANLVDEAFNSRLVDVFYLFQQGKITAGFLADSDQRLHI